MYHLLAENYKDHHTELVSIILKATPVDKIYLLGSTLIKCRTESVFMPAAPCHSYVSHYYVLVLAGNDDNLNAVQDKIENNCRHFIPVTAIVLHTNQFVEWLTTGHKFACTVCRAALLLHGDMDKEIITDRTIDEGSNTANNDSIYMQGLNKVTEFLAGADLYRIREQNKMAAFMLHQAAEQALHTILKITTGLCFNTHNLDKLIRYCAMVCNTLPNFFKRNNAREARQFKLLQSAYTDSRYKEEYAVNTKDVLLITQSIRELQDVMRDVFLSIFAEKQLGKCDFVPRY